MNDSISYSDLRAHLKDALDNVCENHIPLLVTRRSGDDVVILSRNDYESLEETAYLLRSPANAKRLIEALSSEKAVTFSDMEALRNEIDTWS